MNGKPAKAAIWLRVSTGEQHKENQLPDLTALAHRRDMVVTKTYELQESAWRGAHQKVLSQVYQDARLGKFDVLLVWGPWTA